MNLWNIDAAVERARADPPDARSVAGSALGWLLLHAFPSVPTAAVGASSLAVQQVGWLLLLAVNLAGLVHLYRANGGVRGSGLLDRAVVVALPVTTRLLLFQLALIPAVALALAVAGRDVPAFLLFVESAEAKIPISALLGTIWYFWVGKLLARVYAGREEGEC